MKRNSTAAGNVILSFHSVIFLRSIILVGGEGTEPSDRGSCSVMCGHGENPELDTFTEDSKSTLYGATFLGHHTVSISNTVNSGVVVHYRMYTTGTSPTDHLDTEAVLVEAADSEIIL